MIGSFRSSFYATAVKHTHRNYCLSSGLKIPIDGHFESLRVHSSDPITFSCVNHTDFLNQYGEHIPLLLFNPEEGLKRIGMPYKKHIEKFLIALDLWEQVPTGHRPFNKQWYLENSLIKGPLFADELNDIWDYSLRKHLSPIYQVPSDKNIVRITDYNSLFPYRYLIHWEEDTNDMEEWMLKPLTHESSEVIDRLKREIDYFISSLPSTIEWINDEEILSEVKQSMALDDFERYPHFSINNNEFSEKLLAERCKVQVAPSGIRDTVILEKSSSNTIRWIEQQLNVLLDYMPESILGRSKIKYHRAFNRYFSLDSGVGVMRDIKKCGLTIPVKTFINLLVPRLERKYPQIPWARIRIYNNVLIRNKYSENIPWINPKRGIGLGMGNAITTLLLTLVNRIAIKEMSLEGRKLRYTAFIGNDDAVINFTGPDALFDAQDYLNMEKSIYEGLGGIYNLKKSFIATQRILFEEYSHPAFKEKECLFICGLADFAFMSPRISRRYIASMTEQTQNPYILQFIGNYIDQITHDPYSYLPYELGGYIRYLDKETSLSRCLDYIDFINGSNREIISKRIRENEVNISFLPKQLQDIEIGKSSNLYLDTYTGPPIKFGDIYINLSSDDRQKAYEKIRKSRYHPLHMERMIANKSRGNPFSDNQEIYTYIYEKYNVLIHNSKYSCPVPIKYLGIYQEIELTLSDFQKGTANAILKRDVFTPNDDVHTYQLLCDRFEVPYFRLSHNIYDRFAIKQIASWFTFGEQICFVPKDIAPIFTLSEVQDTCSLEEVIISLGLKSFGFEIEEEDDNQIEEKLVCDYHDYLTEGEIAFPTLEGIRGPPGCCHLGCTIREYLTATRPTPGMGDIERTIAMSKFLINKSLLLSYSGNPLIERIIDDALGESSSSEEDYSDNDPFDIF